MMEEAEEQPRQQLPADLFYSYEELHSKPSVTPGSEISEDLLTLWYPTHHHNELVVANHLTGHYQTPGWRSGWTHSC